MVSVGWIVSIGVVALALARAGSADDLPPLPMGDQHVIKVPVTPEGWLMALTVELPVSPLSITTVSHGMDLALTVERPDGEVLARDDDGGIATNAFLQWTPPGPGVYHVRVTAAPPAGLFALVQVLRGTLDPTPPDPALAERVYWQDSYVVGNQKDRPDRVELAIARLAELENQSPAVIRERLARRYEVVEAVVRLSEEAVALHQQSQHDKARQRVDLMLEFAVPGPDGPDQVTMSVASETAMIASLVDDPGLEYAALLRNLSVSRSIRPAHDHGLLKMTMNLAVMRSGRRELLESLALQERVVATARQILPEDHPDLLGYLSNLAGALDNLDLHSEALVLAREVLEARLRSLPAGADRILESQRLVARLLGDLGDVAGALALQQTVVDAWERQPPEDDLELLWGRIQLAILRGDTAAEQEHRAALIVVLEARVAVEHPDLLLARYNLASARRHDNPAGSVRVWKEILVHQRRVLPRGHADTQYTLASLAWAAHEADDRADLADRLVELAQGGLASLASSRGRSPREARALALAADWDRSTVLSLAESAASEVVDELVFSWTETLRLWATSGSLGPRSGPLDEATWGELIRAKRAVSLAVERSASSSADDVISELTTALLRRNVAERRLRARPSAIPDITPERLADVLPPDAAAVGFLEYDRLGSDVSETSDASREARLVAQVLRGDGSVERVDIGSVKEVRRAVALWRAALNVPLGASGAEPLPAGSNDPLETGLALRALVLDPILEIVGESVTTLVICPDDVLHLVPFGALPDGRGVLGERLTVQRELSFGRLLLPHPETPRSTRLVAVGGVDFGTPRVAAQRSGSSFADLPRSRREVEALAGLHGESFESEAEILLGEQATPEAITARVPGAGFVHLATHAFFLDPGPRLRRVVRDDAPLAMSGLALAGANSGGSGSSGRLSAEEIEALDLRDCRLAVLSACETGVGRVRSGMGIASLQAALHAAGVRTTIASLWKVNDTYTQQLMGDFYRRLWKQGKPVAQALAEAQDELRRQRVPAEHWAAWVLTGETGR